ncbi:hypothetical protein BV20DRAFT_1046693 [Pilatotrama ljubarskyi]|nr:hypothetical protein BV20DRAFT_1046693 [Pilatotrama ljubarskyi]
MSNYASDRQADRDFAFQTGNYPPENDTTSEGGYGSPDTFSPRSQRRADPFETQAQQTGLVDQSVDGGPLAPEIQDAKQGADPRAREQFAHEARRDFAHPSQAQSRKPGLEGARGLNPYDRNPDTLDEAREMLASSYADQRGRQFESSGAASNEGDPEAF